MTGSKKVRSIPSRLRIVWVDAAPFRPDAVGPCGHPRSVSAWCGSTSLRCEGTDEEVE